MVTRAWHIVAAIALVGAVDLARSLVPTPAPVVGPGAAAALDPLDVAGATVLVEDADGARACVLRQGRHRCGAKGWQYVGPRELKVGGARAECVWAHPLDGATIVVRYPQVSSSAGSPRSLAFGIADRVSRKGGPVDVDVTFAGETIHHVHPRRAGWSRVTLPEGAGPLTLAISAEKVGQRHLCYRFE